MGCESTGPLPTPTLSATEASIDVGEGKLSGIKTFLITATAPSGKSIRVQRVQRSGTTVTTPPFSINAAGRLQLGHDSTYDAPAGAYNVAIGCDGCNAISATVTIRNVIAIYDIGQKGANFGWDECTTFLTEGSGTLVNRLKVDGFTATNDSKATFFGSKVPESSNGYHFYNDGSNNQLYNSANGLNLASGQENRQVIAYTASKVMPSGLSIKQVVATESSTQGGGLSGRWKNSGMAALIANFVGSTNISSSNASDGFWSFTKNDGTAGTDGTQAICNASGSGNNNRATSGAFGNVGSRAGVFIVSTVCNVTGSNRPHVLCVAK